MVPGLSTSSHIRELVGNANFQVPPGSLILTHRSQKLWGRDLAAHVFTHDSDVAKFEKH